MNLRQFIKNYWAALGGAVLLLWLEFQMDWVGFPYGDEAQKTVNILLLVASFISVLTSNGRAEQRKVELLQIVVLVCEAYLVNVDVFSKPLRQWSDLLYGWNLAWNICGVLELFLVSGSSGHSTVQNQRGSLILPFFSCFPHTFNLLVRIFSYFCL
jgi:hypothetical protein